MATKLRAFRLDDERWERFCEVATKSSLNASQAIVKFVNLAISTGDINKALQRTDVFTDIHTDVNTSVNTIDTDVYTERLTLLEAQLQAFTAAIENRIHNAIADKEQFWQSAIQSEFITQQIERKTEINYVLDSRWNELVENCKREVRTEIERLNDETNRRIHDLERHIDANYFPTQAEEDEPTANIDSQNSSQNELEGGQIESNDQSPQQEPQATEEPILDKQNQSGLTSSGLARLLGVDQSTVSRWKSGNTKPRGAKAREFARWECRNDGLWYRRG